MGYAADRAAQIQALEAENQSRREWTITASNAIANQARFLWDALSVALTCNAEEFAKALPQAKHLIAQRRNDNNLTIETTVQPVVRLEIIYEPGRSVKTTLTEIPSSLHQSRKLTLESVLFTADDDGQASFLWQGAAIHPAQLADILFEPVPAFFQKLASQARAYSA